MTELAKVIEVIWTEDAPDSPCQDSASTNNKGTECVKMAEVDPTIRLAMDQDFANHGRHLNAAASRHQDTAEFISEQSKAMFMMERQLVGAKAAGQLDRDSLAKARLDQGAVVIPANVKPAGT